MRKNGLGWKSFGLREVRLEHRLEGDRAEDRGWVEEGEVQITSRNRLALGFHDGQVTFRLLYCNDPCIPGL